MTSKQKQDELRKIKQTWDWVDLLAHMDECEYDNERYHSKDEFHSELERFFKHVDIRVLFWALQSYEKEVRAIKVNNKEE